VGEEKNETTLKRYFKEGLNIRLEPANPAYETINVKQNKCKVQGKFIRVIKNDES
jgi:SOS-response transcriptional repressor LexA